jgi:hypothetical protein
MGGMKLDHLSYAAGMEGVDATAQRLGDALGGTFVDGGYHPRFGTQNRILPLAAGRYLEVVEVLDHPAAEKAAFGQAVRARSLGGGGWLGWVIAVDDVAPLEARLGRSAIEGSRHLPDGTLLRWQQLGVQGMQSDPQLPFFVHWLSDVTIHPSAGGGDIELLKIEVGGEHNRLDEWLGRPASTALRNIDLDWSEAPDQPGLMAAVFSTGHGEVRI